MPPSRCCAARSPTPIWGRWRWCRPLVRNRSCCCMASSRVAPGATVLFCQHADAVPTRPWPIRRSRALSLTNVQVITASEAEIAAHDPDGTLHKVNPDACCDFRKTVPLERVLSGYDAWITGRKRFQNGQRAALEFLPNPHRRLRRRPGALAPNVQDCSGARGIRWWPRAIRPSAARPAPLRSSRARTPVPGAGAARRNPNAASISSAGAWSAERSRHERAVEQRTRPGP